HRARSRVVRSTNTNGGSRMSAVDAPARVRTNSFARRYGNAVKQGSGRVGLIMLAVIVLLGVVGPWVLPHDAFTQGPDALAPPSATHLLGTDEVGRDVLARVLVGIRLDLLICLVAVPLSAALGTLLGLIGGLSRF